MDTASDACRPRSHPPDGHASDRAPDAGPLPVVAWAATADGVVRHVSAGWTRITGNPPEAIVGDGYRSVIHPDDLERAGARWEAALATSQRYRDEMRIRMADGSFRRMLSESEPVRDTAGGTVAWVGTLVDVDARRTAEEDLAERSRLVDRIFDASANCLTILDAEARIVKLSDPGLRTLGWADDGPVEGRCWLDIWGDERPAAEAAIACARAGGRGRFVGAFPVAGETRWWDVTVAAIDGDAGRGGAPSFIVLSCDVTAAHRERLALAESERRFRSIAIELQSASLPSRLPLFEDISLDAEYRPGSDEATIGGDWYDAFPIDGDRVAFTIGDVLGHGLHAAVRMTKLRQAMQSAAMIDANPVTMLSVADRTLRLIDGETFATAAAAVYDRRTATLVIASAGHPRAIVRRAGGGVEEIRAFGMMLGLDTGIAHGKPWVPVSVPIAPGDALVFYTDGLVEADRDITIGTARLHGAIADGVIQARRPALALCASVLGRTRATDDVAVLVARFGPSEASSTPSP